MKTNTPPVEAKAAPAAPAAPAAKPPQTPTVEECVEYMEGVLLARQHFARLSDDTLMESECRRHEEAILAHLRAGKAPAAVNAPLAGLTEEEVAALELAAKGLNCETVVSDLRRDFKAASVLRALANRGRG